MWTHSAAAVEVPPLCGRHGQHERFEIYLVQRHRTAPAGAESTGLRLPTTVERFSLLAEALAGRSGGGWCRACAFCMGYATKRPQPGGTHRRISPSHRLLVISHRASTAIHRDPRSQRRLHSGHVHCLCINMRAFSVEVARHSMVMLSEHPGRAAGLNTAQGACLPHWLRNV